MNNNESRDLLLTEKRKEVSTKMIDIDDMEMSESQIGTSSPMKELEEVQINEDHQKLRTYHEMEVDSLNNHESSNDKNIIIDVNNKPTIEVLKTSKEKHDERPTDSLQKTVTWNIPRNIKKIGHIMAK